MYHLEVMKTGRPSKAPRSVFGARLLALRQAAGLSQQQMAAQLGISQPAYAAWERTDVALKRDQLAKLAQVLGVSFDELIGEPNGAARRGGPTGKAKRVFETVSQLPRHQQQKILEVVEALVARHKNSSRQTT
jgi:transcriptional regulator with XRE-family HTH domain